MVIIPTYKLMMQVTDPVILNNTQQADGVKITSYSHRHQFGVLSTSCARWEAVVPSFFMTIYTGHDSFGLND